MQDLPVPHGNSNMPPLVGLVSIVATKVLEAAVFFDRNLVYGQQPKPPALE